MKKHVIAAAVVAAFAAPAMAQVTVYGSFDLGYSTVDYKNAGYDATEAGQREAVGVNSGASQNGALTSQRLGFRGEEDLGGGMKAAFNYELGFGGQGNSANDNAGANGSLAVTPRESNVTLSGGFGAVKIGYGTTPIHGLMAGHRAISGSNMAGDLSYYGGDAVSSADRRIHAGAVRASGLTYTSPAISGVNLVVFSGRAHTESDAADSKAGVQNLGYQLQGRLMGVAFGIGRHIATTHATTPSESELTIDVVSAQYAITPNLVIDGIVAKNKTTDELASSQTSKDDVSQLGIRYTMGNIVLSGMMGNGGGEGTSSADKFDRDGYIVSAVYNLSKRTNAYVAYGTQESKRKSIDVTDEVRQTAVGIRHSF